VTSEEKMKSSNAMIVVLNLFKNIAYKGIIFEVRVLRLNSKMMAFAMKIISITFWTKNFPRTKKQKISLKHKNLISILLYDTRTKESLRKIEWLRKIDIYADE